MTLIAGAIATIAGLFPAFAMKLLRFVVLYGFILAPVAAIIVFDVFLSPRFKVQQNYAEYSGSKFNWAVMWAWLISWRFLPSLCTIGYLFILFGRSCLVDVWRYLLAAKQKNQLIP
ncbi:MAG: NCS1 family nucleobase:cation symporter-1 [Cyclobacteriaceae bacterium]